MKVLLEERKGNEEHERLRREAQALARLSHPNVVTVHEVGDDDGELYIAMEYVRGQTLSRWLEGEREWSAVLDAFIQAGRGLQAAHEAGLVHRDFKPQNVVRSEDGVVKVLDFGLVRTPSAEEEESGGLESTEGLPAFASDVTLTGTGAILGTTAYMSPEQLRGEEANDRSDQFNFCVALFQGLYGIRPFEGARLDELLDAIERGELAEIPRSSPVPAAIRRAVLRGLAVDPSSRWPSMESLLTALAWPPERRRSRWLSAALGVGLLALTGAAYASRSEPGEPTCSDAEGQLEGVWDPTRAVEVKAALQSNGDSFSEVAWLWAERELDAYAEDWALMHTQACEATSVRHEQSSHLLDLRMGCLQRSRQTLQATVDILGSGGADINPRLSRLVKGLRPLSQCADVAALLSEVEPPPVGNAAVVEEASQQLARARALLLARELEQARVVIDEVDAALVDIDYGPIQTELALRRGTLLQEEGNYEASEEAFLSALRMALRSNRGEPMFESFANLMFLVGHLQARPEEALRYWAFVEELARSKPLREARIRNIRAVLERDQGDYRAAEEDFRAVGELEERVYGSARAGEPAPGWRVNLASTLDMQGKHEEAEAEFRAVMAIDEVALGSDHPEVGMTRLQLVAPLAGQGRYEDAEREARAGLAALIDGLGPEHPEVAIGKINLGIILDALGKVAEAEAEFRAALALKQRYFGEAHPEVANARINLAAALSSQGKFAEAEAEARAALSIWKGFYGPEHPEVLNARYNLAGYQHALERYEEAATEFREVLRRRTAMLEPDDPLLAEVRINLGIVLGDAGQTTEALSMAEQGWGRLRRDDIPPSTRAFAASVLADTLVLAEGSSRDLDRARRLNRRALQWYRESEADHHEDIQALERWLAENPRSVAAADDTLHR